MLAKELHRDTNVNSKYCQQVIQKIYVLVFPG